MKILIIGQGGREHAMAWKMTQSPKVTAVYVAPGNPGMLRDPHIQLVDIAATDVAALVKFARENHIDLCIPGPEAALAAGISDAMRVVHIPCFGPMRDAAQLETDKHFAKNFMTRHHIPTARYEAFDNKTAALEYLKQQNFPVVIKACGLAAGKGVIIAQDLATAQQTLSEIFDDHKFGDAGNEVVIEDFIVGREMSYIIMVHGQNYVALASSQDHKKRDSGDRGPNTGGMGAFSPSPLCTPELEARIQACMVQPTLHGLQQDGLEYCGFLYFGLMIDSNNHPYLLEYNCRLGDPETQSLLMRLDSDFAKLCYQGATEGFSQTHLTWKPQVALNMVLCAQGYPEHYRKGDVIEGLFAATQQQHVFFAGVSSDNQQLVTQGGRVLAVTVLADDSTTAHQQAHQLAEQITWSGRFYRDDIGSL